MIYIEQPVGTGYSQGTPDAKVCILHIFVSQEFVIYRHDHRKNENDVAAQLVGFLQQFLEIFSELKGKNFYTTGESVSGDLS